LDGLTLPVLLDTWKARRHRDEWTFTFVRNIKFITGKDLTADDVIFTIRYAGSDEEIGSSMLG